MTLDQLLQLPLAQRNEVFNGLAKPERAVLVAEDVLLRIKTKEYIPMSNVFVGTDVAFDTIPNGPLQPIIENLKCNVCAIGATFVSTVRLGNNANVDDVRQAIGSRVMDISSVVFSENELRAMEVVVENTAVFTELTLRTVMELVRYRKKLIGRFDGGNTQTATPIIKALMKNIIKNNGRFVIPGYDVDFDEDNQLAHNNQELRYRIPETGYSI